MIVDHFIKTADGSYAGTHLLIECWWAMAISDPARVEQALCAAAREAGATILSSHSHHFTPNGGVSAVVVLAESHITIHTWPERQFAAVDVFMCGACDPTLCLPSLIRDLEVGQVQVTTHRRGWRPLSKSAV